MGTLYEELKAPAIQDLKVIIKTSTLVFSPQETERKTMFLSNIDQVLNFDVQTLHFFPAHKDFPPEIIAHKLKDTLEKILVPYDFLSGRLKLNPQIARLEIDCNGSGAGFVVASSEYELDDIGDLVYPNPAFEQLVCTTWDVLKPDDQPLCILQVTTFKCGGFAMGISTNHATFDGLGFKSFLENMAAIAANKPLANTPCNDRQLLTARSPPNVTFPHPELLKLNIGKDNSINPTIFEATKEELDFNIFRLNSENITNLKIKAKSSISGANPTNVKITSFNVIAAFIWKCKALSSNEENNMDRLSTILYAVDIRSRLVPPLPQSYSGNAVLTAFATTQCWKLEQESFAKIVEMISEGANRMTNDYARSVIDWGELYKGFPHGEVLLSSWWRLGFAKVEYPWGKPKYSCPLVYHRKDIILLFPDIDEEEKDSGVNVLVALPPKEMGNFKSLFYKFLV